MKQFKLFAIFLFLSLMSQKVFAQIRFRSLKEFNYDTMAYMKGNYTPDNHLYNSLYHSYHHSCQKTIKDVFSDAEIPFKSYVIGTRKPESIYFVLLFTQSAEEVRALYQAGKPVYGVFCDLEISISSRVPNNKIRDLHAALSRLGTNRFNPLDKKARKELQKLVLGFTWFYDQKGWLSMYKVQ